MFTARTPYSDRSRKLVVALDIGTTFSGAAYAMLDPGQVPRIQPVTRYPNSQNLGSAKIPSILYYDHDGGFRGIENGEDFQDGNEFLKMRWWKLMISPKKPSAAMKEQMSTKLPKGKTIVDVFADLMRYLFESTRTLFKTSEPNGETKWDSISNSIELVLSHPNDWGGPQQTQLRAAAVRAGIVPDTSVGHSRVHFVTEGEASFNFCATQTQTGRDLEPGDQVLIIDAGGGTIDVSTYTVLDNGPLQVEELTESKCLLQGGEFVTARARAMVKKKWKGSKFDNPEDLGAFSQKFDEGVKRVFSNDRAAQHVRFGSLRDDDPDRGIKAGRFTLTGTQVSGFFEPSIRSTVDAVKDNLKQNLDPDSLVFLVGGFATSPWLSEQLEKQFLDIGLKTCKPETNTNRAVTVGAILFYVDHFVTARILRFTYGIPCIVHYQSSNPEHAKRKRKSYIDPRGDKVLSDCFDPMLSRGTKVLEDREIRHSFCYVTEDTPEQWASQPVAKYTGARNNPEWMDEEPGKFKTLCNIKADLSTAPYETKRGREGNISYMQKFDVILLVGLTELKAQIAWTDSLTELEKRGPAVVVYNNPSERTG